jgi:hypothetical protein
MNFKKNFFLDSTRQWVAIFVLALSSLGILRGDDAMPHLHGGDAPIVPTTYVGMAASGTVNVSATTVTYLGLSPRP